MLLQYPATELYSAAHGPIYTLKNCFYKIQFNIILSRSIFSSCFSGIVYVYFSAIVGCRIPYLAILLFVEEYKLKNFSSSSYDTSCLLGPNIFFNTLFLYAFRRWRIIIFYPCKTAGKIAVLFIFNQQVYR